VTRYFGGTKLGVGGLGRAYFESAETGFAHVKLISKAEIKELHVSFPFSETNPVMNLINVHKLKISKIDYIADRSIITIQVLPSQIAAIQSHFINATRGSAEISIGNSKTVIWQ